MSPDFRRLQVPVSPRHRTARQRMFAFIINSIYRKILRTSLSGMHKLAID